MSKKITTLKDVLLRTETKQHESPEDAQFNSLLKEHQNLKAMQTSMLKNDQKQCRSLIDTLLAQHDLNKRIFAKGQQDIVGQPKQSCSVYLDKTQLFHRSRIYGDLDQTTCDNMKMKSDIMFLELEYLCFYFRNRKLRLKERIMKKKYKEEKVTYQMQNQEEIQLKQNEKALLLEQLGFLKKVQKLTFQVQSSEKQFQRINAQRKQLKRQRYLSSILKKNIQNFGSVQEMIQVFEKLAKQYDSKHH